MRRRIARQITGMHSVGAVKAHEVMHRCGNKSATARYFHINVRIGHNCAAGSVDNLAVNARGVIALFFNHFKRAGLGQMSGAAARDRRFHHHSAPVNEKCRLLLQIDLDPKRILGLPAHRCDRNQPAYAKSYVAAGNSLQSAHYLLQPVS